ncbi:hypothetical protein ACP70R_016871 [Stipagrostis hirtigluma subsp. patula]
MNSLPALAACALAAWLRCRLHCSSPRAFHWRGV